MDRTGTAPLVGAGGEADPSTSAMLEATRPFLYAKLTEDDVLLGRGKRSYNHEGNCRFRKFVLELTDSYNNNDNKAHRKALAQEVMNRVASNGGKFLRQVEDKEGKATAMFEGVPPPIVRTKVKQALRDMAAGLNAAKEAKRANISGNQTVGPNDLFFAPPSQILNHTLANTASFPGPNFQIGSAQPGSEYSPLLQLAALQQRIQEREQTAMLLAALEQQRTIQMAQLLEQQRKAGEGTGLTPEQQELLRGVRAGPLNGTAPIPLLRSPLSLNSTLLQPPSIGIPSFYGHNMFTGNIHQQPFASHPSVSAQLGGHLSATIPNLASGLRQEPSSSPDYLQKIEESPEESSYSEEEKGIDSVAQGSTSV